MSLQQILGWVKAEDIFFRFFTSVILNFNIEI